MPAILNGETNLEVLKNLTTDELKTAVESDNCPVQPSMSGPGSH